MDTRMRPFTRNGTFWIICTKCTFLELNNFTALAWLSFKTRQSPSAPKSTLPGFWFGLFIISAGIILGKDEGNTIVLYFGTVYLCCDSGIPSATQIKIIQKPVQKQLFMFFFFFFVEMQIFKFWASCSDVYSKNWLSAELTCAMICLYRSSWFLISSRLLGAMCYICPRWMIILQSQFI